MASSINADNGVISGSSGLKSTADASGVLALQTNGTTAVTVNTSQQVGVGTTNPSTIFNVVDANVAGTDNLGNVYIRTTDSYASADVGGKLTLGGFYNGAAHFAFAGIAGRKENATVNNVAGYLQLLTTTSGGAVTERARITSTGAWSFGSSGTATGTAGQVLTSAGSGAAPTWSAPAASGPSIGLVRALAVNCILP